MKILTYNILSPNLAEYNDYGNFKYCSKKYLKWTYRKKKILKQIKDLDADIVCLQEIENDMFTNLIPTMTKMDYIGLFTPKNKSKIDGKIDGCATYFKNTYQLINYKTIDYYNLYKKHLNSKNFNKDKHRAKRPMCGIICTLKKKTSSKNKIFCVCNVHLISDPTRPDVKNLQIMCVLNELSLITNSRLIPFILCGDFNSLPNSCVYETIVTGDVDLKHIELSKKDSIIPKQTIYKIKAQSAYKKKHKTEPDYTNYTDIFNGTIDYIFVSQGWKVKSIDVLNKNDKLIKKKFIPNSEVPSDHLPLFAKIILKS
jgi:mRNA deadenylase 3'-5' endonuclease subunit Ccr4